MVGKNLFDKNSSYVNGFYDLLDRYGKLVYNSNYKTFDYIKVKPNTSYVRTGVDGNRNYYFYNHDKEFIGGNYVEKFTTPSDCHYIRVTIKNDINEIDAVQLEQGDTVTPYEPYKESNIVFYVDEPLRGVGKVKDRVFVKDDKVVVQRNCGSATFDGSYKAPHVWSNSPGNIVNGYYNYNEVVGLPFISSNLVEIINNKLPSNIGGHISTVEGFRATKYYFTFSIHKAKLGIIDVNDSTNNENIVRQWLQQNPITVIYQLEEPVYEEVEYDGNKLIAESFKDGTLFFDSNVPVSSNINYTFTVPVIDEVSALSTTTDEQDTTIASLAYIQNMQAINSK